MRGYRTWIFLLALALVGTGVFFLTGHNAEAGTEADSTETTSAKTGQGDEAGVPPALPVEVAAATSGAVAAYVTATANLVPEREVVVLAEVEGRVTELAVDEGQRVAAGSLLIAVDRREGEIALKTAEVKATDARLAFERAERTFAQDLISREDLDKLSMENEVAAQQLAEARYKLGKATSRAPFAGRIVSRSVQLGQHVRPGDELFRLADFDPLVARIYLPERDVLTLKEGQNVRLALQADENLRFTGRIQQISPVVDVATGTVKVTVEAVAPPAEVRPGAFVTVGIVREQREDAVLVPREAVVRELQQAYVFVVDGETAEKRAVTLGLEESGRVQATSGLAAGERIVVAGHSTLKDGSPVKVLETSQGA